ncbi:hypothetical protein D1B31_03085 [Neobacillus notoginsengisoli]|uniref:Uncharacterized protein n=1 Tax=Neobacillus notoginsengisoli TaxID=1578198 RepID=A0A417YY86_9BACI|nr:hypothetical protein [Neobacillus notoginsengisoli]RHW42593.1 hypothetical protein D1B31_03085 [Neobacillus notoginsengisoli]
MTEAGDGSSASLQAGKQFEATEKAPPKIWRRLFCRNRSTFIAADESDVKAAGESDAQMPGTAQHQLQTNLE